MIRANADGSYSCEECGNSWAFRQPNAPAPAPRTFAGKPACVRCGEEPAITTKAGRPNCGGLGRNCYHTPAVA